MRAIPCAYRLEGLDQHDLWRDLEIVEKLQRDGRSLWAVCRGNSCLNTYGEWEYQPQPSSRTDEFIERTRFSLDDAIARATKAVDEAAAALAAGRRG